MNTKANKRFSICTVVRYRNWLFSIVFGAILVMAQESQGLHWPVPQITNNQPDNTFNAVNCTFGELHGGLRFHGAIDIDHAAAQPQAETILHGEYWYEGGQDYYRFSVVQHKSNPNLIDFDRASVYMHIDPIAFNTGDPIQTGEQMGPTHQGQGHLHLELFERINDVWYAINPLRNDRLPPDRQWSVAEHREGGQLVGYFGNAPIDIRDPEVNQVFLKGIAQPNQVNVASGYDILATLGGLAHFPSQNDQRAARFHFHQRRGASTTNIPVYDIQHERLAVFGNIAATAHARDVAVNQLLAEADNEGLTVHRMAYSVDDQLKYDITFDLLENEMIATNPPQPEPRQRGDDEDIFHYDYNVLTGQDQYADPHHEYDRGNDDYIRLYNAGAGGNDCHNTPSTNCQGAYLPPHKLVNGIQSNGVWFTKARNTTPHVFAQTPTDTAGVNEEALYPDGEHTLTFHVEDAAGRMTNERT